MTFQSGDKLLDYELDLNEEISTDSTKICKNFSTYGYCKTSQTACSNSHDTDLIIKMELIKKNKKASKKSKTAQLNVAKNEELREGVSDGTLESVEIKDEDQTVVEKGKEINKAHNAGLDAFMTGYIMLHYINKFSKFERATDEDADSNKVIKLNKFNRMEEFSFQIYLTGKNNALMVKKSNFASTSASHQEKKQRLCNK